MYMNYPDKHSSVLLYVLIFSLLVVSSNCLDSHWRPVLLSVSRKIFYGGVFVGTRGFMPASLVVLALFGDIIHSKYI